MAYFGISLKNNEEQQEFARLICTTDKQIIFCTGKAGTGKTFCALAAALQLKAIDLCDAMFCEVNPIPVKKAVALAGLCNGYVRMPMTEAEPSSVEKIKKAMTEYGVKIVAE